MIPRGLIVAAAMVVGATGSGTALAQVSPDNRSVHDVVVTGSRVPGRNRLQSLTPVDVVGAAALTTQGTGSELAVALANQVPSLSFPRPSISDGSVPIRPATLRGLAPDQTLVLINGRRGHISASLIVSGVIGRGSTTFDLNSIPTVALNAVEVLRDGASAQYGADAIAGVINLRLRLADHGGGLTTSWGRYDTHYDTARGHHDAADGDQTLVSGWVGLPLGQDGALTLSVELQRRDSTNRSDYAAPSVVRSGDDRTVIARFGDPDIESGSLWFNAEKPLATGWIAYGYGGVQHRVSESSSTPRAFNSANNVVALYPDGFIPIVQADIDDVNLYAGARGPAAGFDWDLSLGYGRSDVAYTTLNTLNASYGAASQTQFYVGGPTYSQALATINGRRDVDWHLYAPANLAFGLEYRRETYALKVGEPTSYNVGPIAAAAGAQGLAGFQPSNAVDKARDNVSAFVDMEAPVTERLTIGAASRYETYSDFGDRLTGKLSARYVLTPRLAARASVSTGFKAPALQQQYFNYVSTLLSATPAGVTLAESGSYSVDDPIAIALGARPLTPERSRNLSAGLVFQSGGFELTVDAYRIDLKDRIVYSEILGTARPSQSAETTRAVLAILAPYGVTGARFFLNGVDTRTQGLDIVMRQRLILGQNRLDLGLSANLNRTRVLKTPPTPTDLSIPVSPNFLFDRLNILTFTDGTPRHKITGSVDWSRAAGSGTLRATYYDSVLAPNNSPSLDYRTGDGLVVDLEARYALQGGTTLAVGVNNLTDIHPNATPTSLSGNTGSVGFPGYSPFGYNGRFLYARISHSF